MTKEIKQYTAEIENILKEDGTAADWIKVRDEMLIRIRFYQHERLIHLIVTVTFALLTIISLCLTLFFYEILYILLTGLFFLLEIPYIAHYCFLENNLQKLYTYYYAVRKKADQLDGR